jgi:beta-glucosidase
MRFNDDFIMGAATASYQVEGATLEGGRGLSIWDVFSHTAGKVVNGDTGDIACDHYHRYAEDIGHMKEMGLQGYRFSIAWPRVFPDGYGKCNERGLDFYRELIELLLKSGIQPMATLYHWDLPQKLQETGGWTNRDTAKAFAEYADTVFHRLGDMIPQFITLNEPWCSTVLGHAFGTHAPGITDYSAAIAASHHLLLAHGMALQSFRDASVKGAQIGITNILTHVEAVTDSKQDGMAAQRMDGFLNKWFLDPLFYGRYPEEIQALGVDRCILANDMAIISQPLDFIGVNFYQKTVVQANPGDVVLGATIVEPSGPRTAMGWGISPDGLRSVLERVKSDYPTIPIYVTESGAAFDDEVQGNQVHDPDRVAYLRTHLEAVQQAMANGVDVRGYYVWSLLDNFEWAEGYGKRFGLIYVNFDSQERLWKDSAKYYQKVIDTRQL